MPTLHTRAPAPVDTAGPTERAPRPGVEVRASGIEGLGAFATEPIAARRKVGEIRGTKVRTAQGHARARAALQADGHVFMIALSDRYALDASASTDPLRHANHSCEPNLVLRPEQGRVAFYALRDIAAGEELTADYGPTHHGGRLACRCGAARCRGWL